MSARPRVARWGDGVTVFACLICQIGMGVGGYIFPVFLKPVVADLDWSRTTYALANPIMSTAVAGAGPFVGWAADRFGPRLVLCSGSIFMGLALAGAGAVQSTIQWYGIAALVGLAVACLGDLPTGTAIAGRFERRRGLALGLVYIGSNIGGAFVPLVATALAEGASWRHAFRVIGGGLTAAVLPFALMVSVPQRRPPCDPAVATGERGGSGPVSNGKLGGSIAVATGGPRNGGTYPWRQRDFWLLFWTIFAFYLYRLGVNVHLVAYLSDLGYSDADAARSFSLTIGLGIAGKLLAGSFADRVGVRPAVLINFGAIAVASALLLAPPFPGAITTFLIIHGAATAAEDVVIPLLVGQRFGSENLGRVYGLLLLALIPGGSFGPLLAGRVFDATGRYTDVFAVFCAGNILALVALALVKDRRYRT